jgi:hypothetical protein
MKEISREEIKRRIDECITFWRDYEWKQVRGEVGRVFPAIVECVLHDRYMIQIPQKAGLGFNVAG